MCPSGLNDKPGSGEWSEAVDVAEEAGTTSTARADVAACMLEKATGNKHRRTSISIGHHLQIRHFPKALLGLGHNNHVETIMSEMKRICGTVDGDCRLYVASGKEEKNDDL